MVFYQNDRARTPWKLKNLAIWNEALDCCVYATAALEGRRKIGGAALNSVLLAKSIVVPVIPFPKNRTPARAWRDLPQRRVRSPGAGRRDQASGAVSQANSALGILSRSRATSC